MRANKASKVKLKGKNNKPKLNRFFIPITGTIAVWADTEDHAIEKSWAVLRSIEVLDSANILIANPNRTSKSRTDSWTRPQL